MEQHSNEADTLIGWITAMDRAGRCVACYVGEHAPGRTPAMKIFAGQTDARRWLYAEARILGLPLRLIDGGTVHAAFS